MLIARLERISAVKIQGTAFLAPGLHGEGIARGTTQHLGDATSSFASPLPDRQGAWLLATMVEFHPNFQVP